MSLAQVEYESTLSTQLGSFEQINALGETLHGASFTLSGTSVVALPDGDIISIYKKKLVALFNSVRLESLELYLSLNQFGYAQLYNQLGYQTSITAGVERGSSERFIAQLTIQPGPLLTVAKKTPPKGESVDRLLGLLQQEPHLLHQLAPWELISIQPVLA